MMEVWGIQNIDKDCIIIYFHETCAHYGSLGYPRMETRTVLLYIFRRQVHMMGVWGIQNGDKDCIIIYFQETGAHDDSLGYPELRQGLYYYIFSGDRCS